MSRLTYTLTLPDGSTETIPPGVYPVRRSNTWTATSTTVSVGGAAQALALAEQEAETAVARAAYLRGLMQRTLAAAASAETTETTEKWVPRSYDVLRAPEGETVG